MDEVIELSVVDDLSGFSAVQNRRKRNEKKSNDDEEKEEESSSGDDDLSDVESESKHKSKEPNTNKSTHTSKRSPKVPPVDIWTENRCDTQKAIQCALPPNSCMFQRVNNSKFRVLPIDAATRLKVIDFAKEKNYQFNTYTPSDEKMINVLIKGLDHIDDKTVIEDALADKGF